MRSVLLRAVACALVVVATAVGSAAAAVRVPDPPQLSARSAAVFEATTGRPLYGVRAGERRLIASTTKMMTALVAVERLHLDRVCVAPPYAAAPVETQIGLRAGERMRVRDLLRGLLLASGNDAAAALATCAAGSRAAFVRLMNEKARALGLTSTRFANPIGLDAATNYSTAADLVRLGIALRAKPFLRRTVDLRTATLTSGDHQRTVVNRNGLVQRVPWVDGVKTGHTNAAGYLLVASGRRGPLQFVAAVTGTPSEAARDADALALLRWAHASYRMATPVRAGAVVARAAVVHRSEERVALVPTRSVRELVRRDQRVTVAVDAPEELEGPLPRHAVVGSLTVRVDGRRIARVPLVTRRAVPEVGLLERAGDVVATPGSLIAIVVVVGGAAVALSLHRRHADRRRQGRADMEAA